MPKEKQTAQSALGSTEVHVIQWRLKQCAEQGRFRDGLGGINKLLLTGWLQQDSVRHLPILAVFLHFLRSLTLIKFLASSHQCCSGSSSKSHICVSGSITLSLVSGNSQSHCRVEEL